MRHSLVNRASHTPLPRALPKWSEIYRNVELDPKAFHGCLLLENDCRHMLSVSHHGVAPDCIFSPETNHSERVEAFTSR